MRTADLALIADTRSRLADGRARTARNAAGLRQREIAETLGVATSTVSQWESGRRVPGTDHALAYGRLLRTLAI